MKQYWFFLICIPLAVLLFYFYNSTNTTEATVEAVEAPASVTELSFQIDPVPVLKDVDRLGINLGEWNLTQNAIHNSGFEGQIDRLIVIVSQADPFSFSDDKGWGYPDQHWKGANFQIRSGKYAGTSGTISDSLQIGKNGFPQYFSTSSLPALDDKDVIVLTKDMSEAIPHWNIRDQDRDVIQVDSNENRPESAGSHSLLMQVTPTHPLEMHTHTNLIAKEASFTLWAKATGEHLELEITIKGKRDAVPLFTKTFTPTPFWQKYTFKIPVQSQTENDQNIVKIAAKGNGKIWLDDLWLGPEENRAALFDPQLITALKTIHPSFIREAPAVGDTLENRLAKSGKRKSWTHRTAGSSGEATFSYSLDEFLTLCKTVKANPWIVVPPTFTDEEYQKFGEYLAQNASRSIFKKVILEFGREHWNWTYRPTSIPYPQAHGAVAERAYEFIMMGADHPSHFIKTVSGPFTDPSQSLKYLEKVKSADSLAIAPYFFSNLDADTTNLDTITYLFHQQEDLIKKISERIKNTQKKLSINEINLNTVEGTASGEKRNHVVTGAISGTALAKRILDAMQAGADPILIYNLFQKHTGLWNNGEKVKLWGIAQHQGSKVQFRPTGLAVVMLNRICNGNVHTVNYTTHAPTSLTILAFDTDSGWSAAIASASETPLNVNLTFPDDNKQLPSSLLALNSASPFDNNEEQEKVTLKQSKDLVALKRTISLEVPPYGFIIVGTETQTNPALFQATDLAVNNIDKLDLILKKFRTKRKELEEALSQTTE